MKSIVLDKIASVTLGCRLRHEVKVSDQFDCKAGDVIAVKILNDKNRYNNLELISGRMSNLQRGDIIAGALGHRFAVQGYAGHVPEKLAIGDRIQLLNMGGVLGICTSSSPLVGEPYECEVLGQVLSFPVLGSRVSTPTNIVDYSLGLDDKLEESEIPVVAVAGTSMNSGKTEACIALVQQFARRGLKVAAAKATGVSLRRDILAMEDAGSQQTMIFTDLGVVTSSRKNAQAIACTLLNKLSQSRPDVIVLELGDGIMGDYGVDRILADASIRQRFTAVVLTANDAVGAWGGVEILKTKYEIDPTVVTGPATDNDAGVGVIEMRMETPAINARTNSEALTDLILQNVEIAHAV